jgi:exosome complex RNA-binding protein Rrp42 (RNase PH superfamily)
MRIYIVAFLAAIVGIVLCFMTHPKKEEEVVCKQAVVTGVTKSGGQVRIDACADARGVEYHLYLNDELVLIERVEQGMSIVTFLNERLFKELQKVPPITT